MRNTYIYTETKKLIKKYGTRDPFEIMDQMNIVVGETSRYKTLKGYCFMSCKTIYVMISSFLSEEEKMIVAAHERDGAKRRPGLFRTLQLFECNSGTHEL